MTNSQRSSAFAPSHTPVTISPAGRAGAAACLPAYPLPVLRLARLGVDVGAQGPGIGKALLRHVLGIAAGQRHRVGCVGVVTDAKAEAVSFYRRLGFVPLQGVREEALQGEPLPMFLPIDTIASAFEG